MSQIIAQWIFDTMIAMTGLMLLVLLVRRPVAQFFGPRVAYALWLLPLARLFMPALTQDAPPPVPAESGSSTLDYTPVVNAADVAGVAAALPAIDWLTVAITLWLGGAALLFITRLAGYFQFRHDILSDGRRVRHHDRIAIVETGAIAGPIAFGVFHKVIAVPLNFFRDFSPAERELALRHEISHHEAGDLAANFVALSILCLHWCNPVAWFAWAAFRHDQETACDARVIAGTPGALRLTYGRMIARSATRLQLGLASPLGDKGKIKGRLKLLARGDASPLRRRLGSVLVLSMVGAALPLTATTVYAESDSSTGDAQENSLSDFNSVHIENDADSLDITLLDEGRNPENSGDYVYRRDQNGKQVVVRTNRRLSEAEIDQAVAEAEASRIEADADLQEAEQARREAEQDMREAEIEMRQALREAEQERREAMAEARIAMREGLREAEVAQREALAEARRAQAEARRIAADIRRETANWSRRVTPPSPPDPPVAPNPPSPPEPVRSSISFAFDGGAMVGQIQCAKAKVASVFGLAQQTVEGCANITVRIDERALLRTTLNEMKAQRPAIAAACKENGKEGVRDLRTYDRDLAELERRLHTI